MKLSAWVIYVIAISISIVVLCFGLLNQFMPNKQEAEMLAANYEELRAVAAQRPQADRRVDDAMAMVEGEAAKWRAYVATRTPPSSVEQGGISLAVNPMQLAADTRRFRNSAQRAVNAQLRRGGVEVVNGPTVPFLDEAVPVNQIPATYFNYPAINFPVVIWEFGTIQVRGSLKQIFDHVRAWSTMPNYLAVTDGLRIDQVSPEEATASYNLVVVGFVRGSDIYPTVPEIGAGAAAAAGGAPGGFGGFGGGPPGGFGGGPPVGFGGPPGFAGGRPGGVGGGPPMPSGAGAAGN
jgi:hypothetical protein